MEVEYAMHQINLRKALGPDDFTSNFFQYFCDLIKQEVWEIVEESHQVRGVLRHLNTTFLTLTPKLEGVDASGKYRPIAPCNVIYNIIYKFMDNILKPILPLLSGPKQ